MIFNYILGGLLCGVVYGLLKGMVYIFKKNFVAQLLADFLFSAFLGLTFIFITTVCNSGQFRLYLGGAFVASFFIERKTLGKLFAKLGLMVYNYLSNKVTTFKSTKVGRVLFK